MRKFLVIIGITLAAVGCKKTGGTGGGGGGGGWLVGSSALMENVDDEGQVARGYALHDDVELDAIACRYAGEAWVVGEKATLLYTNDGGDTWSPQAVPTTGDLRAVATQDFGPVFIAGDGALLVTTDTGATWTQLGAASFRAVAAAQEGPTVLALSTDGGVWSYTNTLARIATFPGAHAVALSPDGNFAMIAGQGMLIRSFDAGATWQTLTVDPALGFDDIRINADGSAVAVGAGGAIANIDASGAVTVQHVGTADLHTLHIADDPGEATGFAAGEGGQVLVTHDSGATWALGANVGRTVLGVDEIGLGHR